MKGFTKLAKTTTEKGLGTRHQAAVEYLKQVHKDGSPCDWCGREMWLEPTKNWDYDESAPGRRGNGVLQGDHSVMTRKEALRQGMPVLPPDRLLHAECNRQRGAGGNDHLASNYREAQSAGTLFMPWPWNDTSGEPACESKSGGTTS